MKVDPIKVLPKYSDTLRGVVIVKKTCLAKGDVVFDNRVNPAANQVHL